MPEADVETDRPRRVDREPLMFGAERPADGMMPVALLAAADVDGSVEPVRHGNVAEPAMLAEPDDVVPHRFASLVGWGKRSGAGHRPAGAAAASRAPSASSAALRAARSRAIAACSRRVRS